MSTNALLVVAFVLMTATALISPAPAQAASRSQGYDSGAYAYHLKRHHSVHRSRNVYDIRGRYRGTDPDPFIRDQLKRCREC
jgi:hypothetical protein